MAIHADNYKNHILIAEDEDGIALYLAAILRKANYTVSIVDNGQKAYEYIVTMFEDEEEHLDLLITDVHMPVLGGMELLDRLKKDKIHLPSIIVTASDERDIVLEALRKGCYEFIEKPLGEKDVVERVDQVFDKIAQEKAGPANVDGSMKYEIPNYRLLEVIGDGTSGTVFLSERVDTKAQYALKVLKIETFDADIRNLYIKRFLNEGFIISQLSHPNIINFIEFGFTGTGDNRTPYIVMEYFKGKALNKFMGKNCKFSQEQRVEIIRQIAVALSFVHSKNILHRDIKPGNILLDEDMNVKLTDFGVCSVPSSDLTMQFEVLGSPGYVAPEYWQHGKASKLVDVYSLGVLAYELFLGVSPFSGDSLHQLRRNIIVEFPKEPRAINPEFSLELQAIIAGMMKKNMKCRYQSADEVIRDLDLFSQGVFKVDMIRRFKSLFSGKDWK